MSGPGQHPHGNEIVIIKRGGHGDHDGHHGGVWKIAYADFMTAMMAFFLVMWLINAANEETRSQVASYFNPVKLTDSVTSDKGLNQPKNKPKKGKEDSPEQIKRDEHSEKEFEERKGETEKKRASEEKLFKDPYVVLAQLAGEAAQGSPAGESLTGAATEPGGHSGLKDGDAYRDPFDPQSWQALPVPDAPKTETAKAEPKAEAKPEPKAEAKPEVAPPKESQAKPADKDPPAVQAEDAGKTPDKKPAVEAEAKPPEKPPIAAAKETPPEPQKVVEQSAPKDSTAKEKPEQGIAQSEASELMQTIRQNLGQHGTGAVPNIAVKATKEGLLISLTDTLDFGMFSIGSAEPKPKVVAIMEKIAGIIKDRPGRIVLRGHTDARPYKSEIYDNWRLSSARAQMAYYMLTRAGIDPMRIERIEGHADRMLKTPSDPNGAENRRIEILLRTDQS